jgi:hypothetical protein
MSVMAEIKLNYINNSNYPNSPDILIFQKNEAASFGEIAIAWKIIQNCGRGSNHPFVFASDTYAAASDSWGNISPLLPAANGQSFSVVQQPPGDVLMPTGSAAVPNEIEIVNALVSTPVNAHIYRSGRLLATRAGLAAGQKAAFAFQPTIWIGIMTQVEQGQMIDSAIMSHIDAQISLTGIKSADIVMTGGGVGSTAMPVEFVLENVVYA